MTDAEAESPILWPPGANNWLIGKDSDAGKDWRQEERGTTEDEIVGWHHQLDRHEFEQALGIGDGQGSLVCWSPWGPKESDTTEWLNWTELKTDGRIIFCFKNLFIFDCAGSSWLCGISSSCWERGLLSSGGAQAYHCGGFSCCRAQTLELGLSSLWPQGLVVWWHMGSSQTRDWTHISCVSCIGMQILDHWVTREALFSFSYFFSLQIFYCKPVFILNGKKNSFLLSLVCIWDDRCLNLLWCLCHNICKSSHHAAHLKHIQCCMSIISQ